MEKETRFIVKAELLPESEGLAFAGEEYNNPLLTWIRLGFADNKPNANGQGIKMSEFGNLIKSMSFMPIKANYDVEVGLSGHDDALQIGVIKKGQQEADKVVAVGALYNDEYPEVIEFFNKEFSSEEGRVDFSWEIHYKDSEFEDNIEWLTGVTTKAITAVENPAYEGRTPLLSISSEDLLKAIDEELINRGVSTPSEV